MPERKLYYRKRQAAKCKKEGKIPVRPHISTSRKGKKYPVKQGCRRKKGFTRSGSPVV